MPRQARKESGTGIYHVMLRGINRQDIFGQPPAASLHVLCLLSDVEPCTFIHQNPTKAGMVSKVGDYDWSSWYGIMTT